MSRICRRCRQSRASSKEHLIADSRLTRIKSYKEHNHRNDNVKKKYRGITCEPCNNRLGEYERKDYLCLAYATVWKLMAGNTNKCFSLSSHKLSNTPDDVLYFCESHLLSVISNSNIYLPDNTFKFDFDTSSVSHEYNHMLSTKRVDIALKTESGDPIEGGVVYVKDRAGSKKEKGYHANSDKTGIASLNILMCLEKLIVAQEYFMILDTETREKISILTDVIIYISFDANYHRLIVILPLIGDISARWKIARYEMFHAPFLDIVKRNIKDFEITSLHKYSA